jgi:hypothetical protein
MNSGSPKLDGQPSTPMNHNWVHLKMPRLAGDSVGIPWQSWCGDGTGKDDFWDSTNKNGGIMWI